jgi:hypothetical protein
MKGRKIFLLFIPVLLVVALVIAVPIGLRALPSRYIAFAANKLPQPLQTPFNQIAVPQQAVAILPTAVSLTDTNILLSKPSPALSAPATALPVTFTPPPHSDIALPPTETPTPVPPTPTPTLPATPTATPLPFPASVRLTGFYHLFQEWNNCGPATMAMTMSYFGLQLSQTDTAKVMKPNPEDRNVSPQEMTAFVNEQTPYRAITRVNGDMETVKRFLANGIPVILEIGIEPPGELRWMGWYGHYMLVVAYDDALERFWMYDSWLGTGSEPLSNADPDGRALSYADVARDWPHFNRNYIAIYRPEQAQLVADIVGEDMDDAVMWQNALAQAQQDAQADPNNAFYWFNLGTSLNEAGDYESAAQAFDQARAIGLPWRMLWYQFGPLEAYLQTGRYDDVIVLADATLKDRPYFEEVFYYKGLALAAQGDVNGARDNLQRAADFNPNFAPAAEALLQLENEG